MIRKYIRQSWELIRSERLYTALYVAGVALSITTVMVLSIVLYVRFKHSYIPRSTATVPCMCQPSLWAIPLAPARADFHSNAVNEFIAPLGRHRMLYRGDIGQHLWHS